MTPPPRHDFDVVVIGAGPAGSLAAALAARQGLSTLLVEKSRFPREKVCGATLNGHALAALERAGLGGIVRDAGGVPLRRFALAHAGRSAVLPLRRHAALSRGRLDLALLEAARGAGARIETGTAANVVAADPDAVSIRLRSQAAGDRADRPLRARIVVAADGLASRSLGEPCIRDSSRVGAAATVEDGGAEYEYGTLSMAVARSGYVGVVRLEDGGLHVATALDRCAAASRGGIGAAARSILESAGLAPIEGLEHAAFAGTPALTRDALAARGRVLAVGDAAGYVEPFTGEGIGWAFESALLAAKHFQAACEGDPLAADRYLSELAATVRRRQRVCRAIAWTLRRAPLVDVAVTLLSEFPSLGEAVLSRFDRAPEPALEVRT